MDNIKIIRLQSGEDIIASYKESDGEGTVLLGNPMTLMFKRLPTVRDMEIEMLASGKDVEDALSELDSLDEVEVDDDVDEEELIKEMEALRQDVKKRLLH